MLHVVIASSKPNDLLYKLQRLKVELNSLGVPYAPHSEKESAQLSHMRGLIFNHTQQLAADIDWDIAVNSIDFTPNFSVNLVGIESEKNMTLLQATMFAFTSSTDLIIALSEMTQLREIMNISNRNPNYPSCNYLVNYLKGDSSAFQLGRFDEAISQFVDQITERLHSTRSQFIKAVTDYIDNLHDSYDVLENFPDAPGTYRIAGPTAREVNTKLSRFAVSYLYMPLIVASFDASLFRDIPDLSIRDNRAHKRRDLMKEIRVTEGALSAAREEEGDVVVEADGVVLSTAGSDSAFEDDEEVRAARIESYALHVHSQACILHELYSATQGNGWLRKVNWLTFPVRALPDSVEGQGRRRYATAKAFRKNFAISNITSSIEQMFDNGLDIAGVSPAMELAVIMTQFFGAWAGLTVDTNSGDITAIDLANNNCSGQLPAKIFSLTGGSLQSVDFALNHLSGALPSQIASSAQLTRLSLEGNKLNGPLSALFGQKGIGLSAGTTSGGFVGPSVLRHLSLQSNRLTGAFPAQLCGVLTLTSLQLQGNKLGGSLPKCIGKLTELRALDLSKSGFMDNLPNSLGKCTGLSSLRLHRNKFTGSIPSNLMNQLRLLAELRLDINKFSGYFPVVSVDNHSLKIMALEFNYFSGSLSMDQLKYPHLISFDGSNNKFTGVIESSLGYLTSVSFLSLQANRLVGHFPILSKHLISTLHHVTLASNQLTGSLPPSIYELSNLAFLDLSSNKFNGRVPAKLSGLSDLTSLRLHENSLSGTVGSYLSICTCTSFDATVQF